MSQPIPLQILNQGRPVGPDPQGISAGRVYRRGPQSININRRERRGYARNFPFEAAPGETLEAFMVRLKRQLGVSKLESLLRMIFLFQEQAIFEAPVLSVVTRAHPDMEGGTGFTNLGPLTYSALLTEIYHNPKALGDLANAGEIFKRYLKKPGSSHNIAMVLGWKRCTSYIVVTFAVLCGLSSLIGVVLGVVCHDANFGATVGGSLFTLLAIIVTLLAWLCTAE